MSQDFADPSLHTIAIVANFRSWIFLPQFALQWSVLFTQIDGTDAAPGCANQQASQWRVHDRIVNFHACASLAIRCWSHPQMPRSAFVQTAARTKSCTVECGGHVIPLFQSRFQ